MIRSSALKPFQLEPSLHDTIRVLELLYPSLASCPYGLRWQIPGGETQLTSFTASQAGAHPVRPRVRSIAVETTLDQATSRALQRRIPALNTVAGIAALMASPRRGRLRLSTAINSDQSAASMPMSNALVLLAATMHAEFADSTKDPSEAPESFAAPELQAVATACPWTHEEFQNAATAIKSKCSSLSLGPRMLSAEKTRDDTNGTTDFQFVIQAGIQHRVHGVGLLSTLVVPHHLKGTRSRFNAAARLNQIEFASLNAPDFLGGWSAAQRVDSLTYTSFLPDRALLPGLVARLARGAVVRARLARVSLPKDWNTVL